jgi:hypothetical protein
VYGYPISVDFNKKDGGVLRLCLDDIHPGNFRKDENGQLFVLDFGLTNFLPSYFQELSFVSSSRGFVCAVGKYFDRSESDDVVALVLAAVRLNVSQNNDHGKLLAPPIFARVLRNG